MPCMHARAAVQFSVMRQAIASLQASCPSAGQCARAACHSYGSQAQRRSKQPGEPTTVMAVAYALRHFM